jgi:hypothetical protein
MKGLFNKALVIALLVSVCGVRAEVTDMSGKQLFVAAATQLSKEAKDAAVAGLNVVKNSEAVRVAGDSIKYAGSAIATRASDISAKLAPALAKQTDFLKHEANKIASDMRCLFDSEVRWLKVAGSAVKNSAAKAIEASKPALTAVLGYAMHAKDGVKSFYAHHTEECQVAAVVAAYVSLCVYADYVAKQARIKAKQARDRKVAQANHVAEATHVDVNELNNHVVA